MLPRPLATQTHLEPGTFVLAMLKPIQSALARVLQQEDLGWLVCPACRQSLVLDADLVRCNGCRRGFPIIDGIPVLLADRAR